MRRLVLLLSLVPATFAMAAGDPPLTSAEMKSASRIYVAKCAKCHQFYEPRKYSEDDWRRWIDSMSRKSKLKPKQEALLDRFLEAYRAGEIKKTHGR